QALLPVHSRPEKMRQPRAIQRPSPATLLPPQSTSKPPVHCRSSTTARREVRARRNRVRPWRRFPTGVLLMGTGAKVGLGCVALALLAALWWSFGSEPAASTSTAAAGGSQATAAGSLAAAASSPAGNEREEVPASGAPPLLAEGRTAVRGRCVDENGKALPGCEVELRGRKVLERGGPDLRR